MSWILLPWPPRLPSEEEEETRAVLVELRESPRSCRPFREEKRHRAQEEKAEDPSGPTTSTNTGIEAREPTTACQTPSGARKEARAAVARGIVRRKAGPGGRATGTMGAYASRLPNGCPSSTPSTETAEEVAPETKTVEQPETGKETSDAQLQDARVQAAPLPEAGEYPEVSSHTLEEPEDSTTQKDSESSEEDNDSSGKEEEEGEVPSPSSQNSDDWETPPFFPRPWMRFATVLSEIEPWNARAWHGFDPSVPSWGGCSALPWGAFRPMSERLRCSIVYASVMLRSYRRKFFRKMKASIADWKFMPTCPKRSPRPKAEMRDL